MTDKLEQIATADLIPYARNARTHSPAQVAGIAGSIREFGFNNPVLIDKDNGIIAGHGRVMAAQQLGLDTVPCLRLGHLTKTQRKAYILADNRLAELAGWDTEMLALEIADLRLDDVDLELLGFDDDALRDLLGESSDESINGDIADDKESLKGNLAERFMIPPFSVLNAREGWWQDRKRAWLAIGIQSELGRGGGLVPHPIRPLLREMPTDR